MIKELPRHIITEDTHYTMDYLWVVNQLAFCKTLQHGFVLTQVFLWQMLSTDKKQHNHTKQSFINSLTLHTSHALLMPNDSKLALKQW